jgi:nitrate/nitrite transport system substrate-binding protein
VQTLPGQLIASVMPLGALEAMAQDKGSLEKKDLKIGFIAITCASPLIMADPLGFYRKEGLNVQLNKQRVGP